MLNPNELTPGIRAEIMRFVEDRCLVGDEECCGSTDLFNAYCAYLGPGAHNWITHTRFSRLLRLYGAPFHKVKNHGRMVYRGVSLLPDFTGPVASTEGSKGER